jgi:hypothetical protein
VHREDKGCLSVWPFQKRTSSTNPSLPSRKELIGRRRGPLSLDEECVVEDFLGVTAEDFRERLVSEGGIYQEDFMWMAYDGLRYYMPVVFDFLKSPEANDDWEVSRGILCSLSAQITSEWFPADLSQLALEIVDYIDANREKFDIKLGEEDDLEVGYFKTIRKHANRRMSGTA